MIKGIVIGFFLAIAILAGGFFYYFAAGNGTSSDGRSADAI